MEISKIDLFIMTQGHYFEGYHIRQIREELAYVEDAAWLTIEAISFKEPSAIQIVSMIGGVLGIDRFLIGDTGIGIGKLLTCGGFGIWAIIDYFLIESDTKRKNMEKLMAYL